MADLFFVYILASRRNGTLYVGVTNDLARRAWEHKQKILWRRSAGVLRGAPIDPAGGGSGTRVEAMAASVEDRIDRETQSGLA
jgi:GIY-YIG catalytic domain-containing protein